MIQKYATKVAGSPAEWVLLPVFSTVDDTHTSAPDLFEDFVVGYGLADHGTGTRSLSSSNQLRTMLIWGGLSVLPL